MVLEVEKTVINVNGVSIPGINRNGVFIGEEPIDTFALFRAGAFTAGSGRQFLIDFPVIPKSVIFSDTTSNNTYTFGSLWIPGIYLRRHSNRDGNRVLPRFRTL